MAKYTKSIKIGNRTIGGKENILIQSMVNKHYSDINGIISQINELENAGCEIVRISVVNEESAKSIGKIKEKIDIPLVADIHFDYRLALLSIEYGIDKLRINPGNIGEEENIKKVVESSKKHNIPIRIGVNGGSLEKHILDKYKFPNSEAMVESAMYHINLIEKYDYNNIIVSLKSSNVSEMYNAYKIISKKIEYPLHLGVTEAGTAFGGTIKSAIGIGGLILEGIGDTIRVSLTEDPIEEIKVAKEILKVTGIRKEGVEIISCPTCGRTEIDLVKLAKEVEKECKEIKKYVKIAVMGCVVNGPGEAKDADFGIAGGKNSAVIFKKGEIIKKVSEKDIIKELKILIKEMV
ncbi:MAG: flavodoxin-dependent (E)-4-hydroxy-3-methylbut-2-enyl-diphosphate synthase [Fusobacteria bacterium]|nr:flavodoxin-dependent (E)-4-hydroxy-3-methylbut-2-enyl-diphosphate synthase [Fusobacteriota bacterium]